MDQNVYDDIRTRTSTRRQSSSSSSLPSVRRLVLVCSLLLFVAVSNFGSVDASYAISIGPGDEECYIFMSPKDVNSFSTFSGSFEILHDDVDSYELSVRVVNLDTGEAIHDIPSGTQEGDFTIRDIKAASKYSICFQNNESTDDEENEFDLGFNVRFHNEARTLEDGELGPDGERANKLAEKAAAIHEDWDTLQDHFEYLRNREGIHYGMNNEIMTRLSRWTYIEALLVIGMAVGQVMYWKKFFEKRQYL